MGDGQVERQNRTLINMLRALGKNDKNDWKRHLAKLAFACNSTVNKSTGFSPHFLMFGREAKLPIDLVFQQVGLDTGEEESHEKFAKDWEDSMKKAYEVVRNNIRKSAGYNKKSYDKKAKAVEIKVGDMVLVRNYREKGGTGKLKSYWQESIFKVLEVEDNIPVYKIKNLKKSKDIKTVHRNKLMKVDELALDIFDEEEVQQKPKTKTTVNKEPPPNKHIEDLVEDSDDSDVELTFENVVMEQVAVSYTHLTLPTKAYV